MGASRTRTGTGTIEPQTLMTILSFEVEGFINIRFFKNTGLTRFGRSLSMSLLSMTEFNFFGEIQANVNIIFEGGKEDWSSSPL